MSLSHAAVRVQILCGITTHVIFLRIVEITSAKFYILFLKFIDDCIHPLYTLICKVSYSSRFCVKYHLLHTLVIVLISNHYPHPFVTNAQQHVLKSMVMHLSWVVNPFANNILIISCTSGAFKCRALSMNKKVKIDIKNTH